MARVASQSKNNARETPDVTQKIKQTVNSARLLIAVHVESENFLIQYFVCLDLNLGQRVSRGLVHSEIIKILPLSKI
jgi:hypothetical protein